MSKSDRLRQRVRVATAIHALTSAVQTFVEPMGALRSLVELENQLARFRHRATPSAFARICGVMEWRAHSHIGVLEQWRDEMEQLSKNKEPKSVPLKNIYDDLCGLEDEFDEVEYWPGRDSNNRNNTKCDRYIVSATTDHIRLDGMHFGEFEIKLAKLPRRGSREHGMRFCVVAVNPVSCPDERITHPHVCDNLPCLGDGSAAVDMALKEGRILDAFMIVNSVLHTYSPDSAYRKISNWDGDLCVECGDGIDDEDSYRCEECGDTLCGRCGYDGDDGYLYCSRHRPSPAEAEEDDAPDDDCDEDEETVVSVLSGSDALQQGITN